jgi:hypothetical protein
MYSLEYRMMVQVLRQLGYSGEFHADVPSQTALRGGGKAVLIVHRGNVASCFILDKYGQKILHDEEAIYLLSSCGILDWRLAPSTSGRRATPPGAPAAKPSQNNRPPIPYRLAISESQMRTWSPLERSVYVLCDGKHSVEQIAALLSRPLSMIGPILHKLEASGAITRL